MNRLNKFLKIFLVFAMLGIQFAIPLEADATNDDNYFEVDPFDDEILLDEEFDNEWLDEEFDDEWLDDEFDVEWLDDEFNDEEFDDEWLDDDFDFDLDFESDEYYYNAESDESHPAITGYVPEMLYAEDMLEYIEDEEIFEQIAALNSANATRGSGLVQFVLEPVSSSLPSGVTMAQARAAAFNASTVTHTLFANATTTNAASAINGRFGRDAIFLGRSGNRYRVMIGAFEGYVNRTGSISTITVPVNGVNRSFQVRANAVYVPFGNYPSASTGNVRSASHYVNRNGNLYRYLTNNVSNTGGFVRFLTGPAPSWMSRDRRYYSFDGVYFYRNPRNIRVNGSGAVNANNPFFNYFQYLSLRSTSRVTASQLDTFLRNDLGTAANRNNSVLTGQGRHFVNAQNRYGVNALLSYAKAMHESGRGLSTIARNNNNVFGLNAVDSAPGQNASVFRNVQHSVDDYANHWMSRGYLWPGDWRYMGPHVGHKGSGINVRYATDPYWGQKIAGWAFRIDRTLGNQDRNREQIAIRQNTSSISVTNSGGTRLYTANPNRARYFPFLVTGTGSNNRLRVLTDPAIVSGSTNRTARYNRGNAVGFIPNSNRWLTGASSPSVSNNHQISGIVQTGVTRRNTAFRRGPGANYGLIRTVNGSSNVRITGRTGAWYRVNINGTVGFIRRTAVARTRQFAVVSINNAHVRSGRGTSYRSLTRVSRGRRVTVARRSANWSRITANGHTGWIRNRDLHMENAMRPGRTSANNVAIHTRPRSAANVRRRIPRNTRLMIVQRTTDGWSQIRIRHSGGTLHGWVRTNQIERSTNSRRLVRDGALRGGPSTDFSRNRTIPRNTSVTVRSRVGNWYHVHVYISGRRHYGWLHQNNLPRLPRP